MPTIKPISDLRNYNAALMDVSENSPVYLTRNGRGVFAVVTIEDYERMQSEIKLFSELRKGIASAESGEWVNAKDAKKHLGL